MLNNFESEKFELEINLAKAKGEEPPVEPVTHLSGMQLFLSTIFIGSSFVCMFATHAFSKRYVTRLSMVSKKRLKIESYNVIGAKKERIVKLKGKSILPVPDERKMEWMKIKLENLHDEHSITYLFDLSKVRKNNFHFFI